MCPTIVCGGRDSKIIQIFFGIHLIIEFAVASSNAVPTSGHARRLSSSSSQHRPSSRDGPQYFLLEHGNRPSNAQAGAGLIPAAVPSQLEGAGGESKSDDPAFHRLRAIRQATQQQQQLQQQRAAAASSHRPAPPASAAKPNIAPKPSVKPSPGVASGAAAAQRRADVTAHPAGRPVTSSSRSRPELSSGEGLDEEEGTGAWNEITLRPTRFNGSHNVNNVRTENKTGKTSWP